jgi:hypothetical protein
MRGTCNIFGNVLLCGREGTGFSSTSTNPGKGIALLGRCSPPQHEMTQRALMEVPKLALSVGRAIHNVMCCMYILGRVYTGLHRQMRNTKILPDHQLHSNRTIIALRSVMIKSFMAFAACKKQVCKDSTSFGH